MRHGSLFSGIGGFDLAAQWMGWENVFQVEIDPFCQKVLAKNFPNVKRYGDIKEFKGQAGSVDILSGGFPCQPFSTAGKRKGESDDRYLWPEYLRIIREIKPAYVVGENVAGLVSMEDGKTLEGIFTDLEGEGYQVESFIIPACGVGAWHRRDRIWIVANSGSSREARLPTDEINRCSGNNGGERTKILQNVPNSDSRRLEGASTKRERAKYVKWDIREESKRREWWESEPNVGRVANGIPKRVDRLKGLGNAIVPQACFELFKAIDQL
jgi:DNA (cytosine-5)-methyltransferase 1